MFDSSRFWTLAVLPLVLSTTQASVLVVDQQNPAASEQNSGSPEKPFNTISAAAAKARAGDKVVIHGGTYRETVVMLTSGSKEAPITFEAAPNELPIIKGSDLITDWSLDRDAIWKAKLRVPPPRQSTEKGHAYWETNDVRQVFSKDGALFDARPLMRVLSRDAMQQGTFFCDRAASLLYVWLPDSASPVDHPPEASVRAAWLNVYADHIVIRGLQMRQASTTADR